MEEMPVFVKIDEYKDVLEVLGAIKSKVEKAKDTIRKINELKNQEDSELEKWSSLLDDIERKVDFVDRSMFEPETL